MKKRKKASPAGASRKTRPAPLEGRSTRMPVKKAAAAPKSPRRKSASSVFELPMECAVADAEALKADLARIVGRADPITLDVGQLQRIDTAGLQVITSFLRERDRNGRSTGWAGRAPVLVSAAKLLGLAAILRLPAEVTT